MSLKINIDVKGIEDLQKQIDYVNKMLQMKTDKSFQKYIQERVLETVKRVATDSFNHNETTNSEWIEEYQNNHKIREIDNGFELYNDLVIPSNQLSISKENNGYSNGFNIAMAFEYGVGIVGMSTNNPNAWEYNVNNYNFGWKLPYDVADKYGIPRGADFAGYKGLEIYRNTAIEVEKRLKDWVEDYLKTKKK